MPKNNQEGQAWPGRGFSIKPLTGCGAAELRAPAVAAQGALPQVWEVDRVELHGHKVPPPRPLVQRQCPHRPPRLRSSAVAAHGRAELAQREGSSASNVLVGALLEPTSKRSLP